MATPVNSPKREVFTSGRPQPVDVRALEQELHRLWKSAVQEGPADTREPVGRACVLTLVAVVQGDGATAAITGIIAGLTERAPCRALVVNCVEEERDSPLSAWASAHCHRVSGGRQVCCEQVTVAVSPSSVGHVGGLVVPLLVPDLPVFLYWPSALSASRPNETGVAATCLPPLLSELSRSAEFVILDTACARDPEQALIDLAAMMTEPRGGWARPRDLNWSRLTPWREALADYFEPAERRGWLDDIEEVVIRCAGGSEGTGAGVPARPLFLLSWLAGRLGWKREGLRRRGDSWVVSHDNGARARVEYSGEGEPRGRINGLVCRCGSGRRLEIERRSETALQLTAYKADHTILERRRGRAPETEEYLLGAEIDLRITDPVFRETLGDCAGLVREIRQLEEA